MLRKNKELCLRIREDALFSKDALQLGQLGFDFASLQTSGMVDESAQARDLRAKVSRIDRCDDILELGDDFLLLFFGQFVEVVRQTAVDLLSAVFVGIGEDLLPAIPHALQSSPDRVDSRSHAALQHCHRKPDRAAAGRFIG